MQHIIVSKPMRTAALHQVVETERTLPWWDWLMQMVAKTAARKVHWMALMTVQRMVAPRMLGWSLAVSSVTNNKDTEVYE